MTIEDILLMRAQQDAQTANNIGTGAAILGAGIGGTAGITIGDLQQRLMPTPKGGLNAVKPGMRMAGGLVGAILGGALGAGTRELMMKNSPSASILAKLQTDGSLSTSDTNALQSILADTYSSTLSM